MGEQTPFGKQGPHNGSQVIGPQGAQVTGPQGAQKEGTQRGSHISNKKIFHRKFEKRRPNYSTTETKMNANYRLVALIAKPTNRAK
jgi:hypothetical protein